MWRNFFGSLLGHILDNDPEQSETKSYDKSLQKELIKDKIRQLKAIINYATTKKCLHHVMLDYFGEMSKNKCFMCSNCQKKK